jgi:hypothetical protein
MKTVHLLISAALISLFSAFIGGMISYELFCHRPIEDLRIRHLEIEDSKGQIRAGLGTKEDGNAQLRFLSPHQEPLLLIGTEVEDSGSKAEIRQLPFVRLNAQDGGRAIEMFTTKGGNGTLAFDSKDTFNTLMLGYYGINGDFQPLDGDHFAWGLRIHRENGETGVGIVDKSGLPVTYISPVPNQDAIRRQK